MNGYGWDFGYPKRQRRSELLPLARRHTMSVTLRCDFCGNEIDARKQRGWHWASFPVGDARYTFGQIEIYSATKCPDCINAEEQAANAARKEALRQRGGAR